MVRGKDCNDSCRYLQRSLESLQNRATLALAKHTAYPVTLRLPIASMWFENSVFSYSPTVVSCSGVALSDDIIPIFHVLFFFRSLMLSLRRCCSPLCVHMVVVVAAAAGTVEHLRAFVCVCVRYVVFLSVFGVPSFAFAAIVKPPRCSRSFSLHTRYSVLNKIAIAIYRTYNRTQPTHGQWIWANDSTSLIGNFRVFVNIERIHQFFLTNMFISPQIQLQNVSTKIPKCSRRHIQ